jgi:hypothetical protein
MEHFITKLSRLGIALIFVLFACGNADSQDKITLEYNLKQGETYKQNMVSDIKITQKIMDNEMKIDMKMSMKMDFDVKEVQDNRYIVEMKYKEMKIVAGASGMAISFDSNTPEDIATQKDLGPMLKAIIDKPLEIIMNKQGKVESAKGFEKLKEAMLNSLDENVPDNVKQQIIGQFGSQISEESLKSMLEQNTGFFPDKPVAVNDSWVNSISVQTSGFGLNINMKSVLKSIENNVVTLDIEGTVATPEGFEQEINGTKAKVSLTGTQKGSMKINKDTGWVISSEIVQDFSGDIEIMGMKVPLSATSTSTIAND